MQPTTKTPLSEDLRRLIGQPVSAIDTPSLVVDIDAMQRNLSRMAEFARKHDIRWRAHAKTHKSSALAKLAMQAGASGICVQKTSEAEAMAAGGVTQIFISNVVIAPQKLARVADLAHRLTVEHGQLAIAVDSVEGVRRLSQAMNERRNGGGAAVIDVYVELDVGQGRCGVTPGRQAVELALEVRKHPALRFAGLQAYHGKAQHMRTPAERRDAISVVVQDVLFTRKLIESEGVPVDLITGAGTGSMVCEAASGAFGELQPGSFLFMDGDYAANERDPAQPAFEHALFVKSQVVSSGVRHAVCDAGHKSHAVDSGLPTVLTVDETGELKYANGGDEHGILRPTGKNQRVPQIGDDIWLIPGHCDPTVNLHNHLVGVGGGLANGKVERIIRVDARGALT
ncbi:DSD1 family PLP-dependent enzyme [Caenimonas sedimenti]|uniref:DSD1 family PLP-dependent enzyme n=1 Tax=Caenimonas sedimenti TaxID=2596921 RepID=A0A562ZED3_9BURK|nr:DSD1 family PLP-dependent enzyme [Caenimonas sedimenti]TWO64996.1 DSD1 family PLP-dependent enzyme [Caenimonas sedimenti]